MLKCVPLIGWKLDPGQNGISLPQREIDAPKEIHHIMVIVAQC